MMSELAMLEASAVSVCRHPSSSAACAPAANPLAGSWVSASHPFVPRQICRPITRCSASSRTAVSLGSRRGCRLNLSIQVGALSLCRRCTASWGGAWGRVGEAQGQRGELEWIHSMGFGWLEKNNVFWAPGESPVTGGEEGASALKGPRQTW
jgi:hypothetical protein